MLAGARYDIVCFDLDEVTLCKEELGTYAKDGNARIAVGEFKLPFSCIAALTGSHAENFHEECYRTLPSQDGPGSTGIQLNRS